MMLRVVLLSILTLTLGPAMSLQFVQGHYYSANAFENTIMRYDQAGTLIETFIVSPNQADQVKGIGFGPDGYLYAVAQAGSNTRVLVISSGGSIVNTYLTNLGGIGNNLSYGKISFGNSNDFYVSTNGGLLKFAIGDPSATSRFRTSESVFDSVVLPSGNLLIADANWIREHLPNGDFVRFVQPTGVSLGDLRGLEYDPASDSVFVSMLSSFRVVGFSYQTMQVTASRTHHYADDLFLGSNGLAVGSRTLVPTVMDRNLSSLYQLGSSSRHFVTQMVPEPTAVFVLAPLVGLFALRKRFRPD